MTVVPLDEETDLAPECSPIERHENATKRLALHGPHEPLDHRDAAVFLDSPETLADASALAPIAKSLIGELRPLIRDEVVKWSSESEVGNLGHFNHWLSRRRGRKRLKRKAGGQDQVRTALNHVQQLPSGRTSTLCGITTQTSNLELRGFFQFNDW